MYRPRDPDGRIRLTGRQEIFCLKYFETGLARESAIAAGYSPKTAHAIASHNLATPHIQARLAELRQKTEDDSVMAVLERKQVLSEIARANMMNFVEVGQDGAWFNIDETNLNSRAIQSVQSKTVLGKDGADDAVFIRVNLHDPTKAIDLLNKMDKLYSDAVQVNIDNRKMEAQIVNFDITKVARAVIEAIRLGISPELLGGNGQGQDAAVHASSADVQAVAVPEPEN